MVKGHVRVCIAASISIDESISRKKMAICEFPIRNHRFSIRPHGIFANLEDKSIVVTICRCRVVFLIHIVVRVVVEQICDGNNDRVSDTADMHFRLDDASQ